MCLLYSRHQGQTFSGARRRSGCLGSSGCCAHPTPLLPWSAILILDLRTWPGRIRRLRAQFPFCLPPLLLHLLQSLLPLLPSLPAMAAGSERLKMPSCGGLWPSSWVGRGCTGPQGGAFSGQRRTYVWLSPGLVCILFFHWSPVVALFKGP